MLSFFLFEADSSAKFGSKLLTNDIWKTFGIHFSVWMLLVSIFIMKWMPFSSEIMAEQYLTGVIVYVWKEKPFE